MLTIKQMISDTSHIDDDELVKLSDKLWEMGTLEEIKEKVDPDLFLLHIAMNTVGNWQCDGWWCIISEHAELVPFIPQALEALGLYDLNAALEKLISIFPAFTVFSNNDSAYCDIANFLQNVRFKVSDERLNSIAPEKRIEMVNSVHRQLDRLEDMTDPLWGYDAECDGWKQVLDFVVARI